MAVTQADIDKLDAAIAGTGAVEELEVAGQRYRFRSIDDMLKLRAVLSQQLNAGAGAYRLAATSKGV
jgi:hypothetical protein